MKLVKTLLTAKKVALNFRQISTWNRPFKTHISVNLGYTVLFFTTVSALNKEDNRKDQTTFDFQMEPKPKLVVFDLDRTLWPFWVDTHVDPPFEKRSNGKIYDSYGRHVKCFPDVPDMLKRLTDEGFILAAASRTGEIDGAEQLLHLFDWNKYFTYKEIYPGCKKTHFSKFKKATGFQYSEMIFFDDEYRNIVDISSIGVTCVYCEQGMSNQVLEDGFKKFRAERSKTEL